MSLNVIIDFILNCMYVNIRKCRLLSKTNFVMMSNIMLLFLLLLFLAGVLRKTLALGTHQSRTPTTHLQQFFIQIIYQIVLKTLTLYFLQKLT